MKAKKLVKSRQWWLNLDLRFGYVIDDIEDLREVSNIKEVSLGDIKYILMGYLKEDYEFINSGYEDACGFKEYFGLGAELMKIVFQLESEVE
jgi:hypothetical protein